MLIEFQSQGQTFTAQLSNVSQRHFESELTMSVLMTVESFPYRLPATVPLMTISANKLTIRNVNVPNTSAVAQFEHKLPLELQGKGFALHVSIFKDILSRLPAGCFTVADDHITIGVDEMSLLITEAFQHIIEDYSRISVFHHSGYVYSISSLQTSVFATREWEAGKGEPISRAPTKLIVTQHELDISYSDDKCAHAYSTVIRLGGYKLDLLPVFASQERTYALFGRLLETLDQSTSFSLTAADLILAISEAVDHN